MSDVVRFGVQKFRLLYPSITLSDVQLHSFFTEACILCNNTKKSVIKSTEERELLLFLLVAHIATLQMRLESGNEAVGRIAGASEGSVSVSLDYGQSAASEKWYLQTQYGARYWALTRQYRSFLYIAGRMPMPVRR